MDGCRHSPANRRTDKRARAVPEIACRCRLQLAAAARAALLHNRGIFQLRPAEPVAVRGTNFTATRLCEPVRLSVCLC